MNRYKIRISKLADQQIAAIKKSGDKAALKKIQKIIDELAEHPFDGSGNPEQLKYELSGMWSRRITPKDRIIYQVDEEIYIVSILSVIGHYADK